MSAPDYRMVVSASSEQALGRLPEAVAAAVVEFTIAAIVESPRRVGRLRQELSGLWAARGGPYLVTTRSTTTSAQ